MNFGDTKITEENFDDYIMNLENVAGVKRQKRNKRIILSGDLSSFIFPPKQINSSLFSLQIIFSRISCNPSDNIL